MKERGLHGVRTRRVTSLDGYYSVQELAWSRNESYQQTRRWLIAHKIQCVKIGGTILVPTVGHDPTTLANLAGSETPALAEMGASHE